MGAERSDLYIFIVDTRSATAGLHSLGASCTRPFERSHSNEFFNSVAMLNLSQRRALHQKKQSVLFSSLHDTLTGTPAPQLPTAHSS